MPTLLELIAGPDKRGRLIDDALRVLDAEVADKSGLSGIAVKTAYKVVKSVSPGFLRDVVDHLLNDFVDGLDPLYQEAVSQNIKPRQHLQANPSRVADALLGITDRRAQRAKNQMVKATYEKLRGQAKKHVEAAVPRLGELFERHAG
ncbi:MAG TPA: hypothetical protein VK509_03925 [Polyangiales bacterium]|nr:hypothetical protein [Polyangiales bacterium]